MRIIHEEMTEKRRRTDSVKLALLTGNPSSASVLFPDMFPPSVKATTEQEIEAALSGNGPVIIESMSNEDIESVLARIGDSGEITSEDLNAALVNAGWGQP